MSVTAAQTEEFERRRRAFLDAYPDGAPDEELFVADAEGLKLAEQMVLAIKMQTSLYIAMRANLYMAPDIQAEADSLLSEGWLYWDRDVEAWEAWLAKSKQRRRDMDEGRPVVAEPESGYEDSLVRELRAMGFTVFEL